MLLHKTHGLPAHLGLSQVHLLAIKVTRMLLTSRKKLEMWATYTRTSERLQQGQQAWSLGQSQAPLGTLVMARTKKESLILAMNNL